MKPGYDQTHAAFNGRRHNACNPVSVSGSFTFSQRKLLINFLSLVRRRQPKSPQPADSSQRKRKRQASNQRATDTLDEDLALESTQPLLPLTTPAADHQTAGPSSTRSPRVKDSGKPKCTMCQTKNAKVCVGGRPPFRIYSNNSSV